ncbi:MAG: DUF4037 domain-containing protein [Anaerolineae bacterium]|nr:DUF4037 domain-containing protein [Anaerolineae bacterium]
MSQTQPTTDPLAVAQAVADLFAALPQVEAVALAGSQTTGVAEPGSDLDLYVYSREPVSVADRARLITPRASRLELDNQFWEPGDEWIEAASGLAVDVMYRAPAFIEAQLDRLLVAHEASVGYSTAFWHNVLTSRPLFDRAGWFVGVQARARQPYPEPLRAAIVAKNWSILARTISSYRRQLEKAVSRGDLVSVNHRVAALLASYFDILFALNRLPHPGEKRLLAFAAQRCSLLPIGMTEQVESLLRATAVGDETLLAHVDTLVAGLEGLLRSEGFLLEKLVR